MLPSQHACKNCKEKRQSWGGFTTLPLYQAAQKKKREEEQRRKAEEEEEKKRKADEMNVVRSPVNLLSCGCKGGPCQLHANLNHLATTATALQCVLFWHVSCACVMCAQTGRLTI